MRFDQLAETVNRSVARPWFFWSVIAAIALWVPTLAFTSANTSDLVIDALTNPLSLVLLVLLHNSQHRAGVAQDHRQDDVERALALLMRHLARHDPHDTCRDELEREACRLVAAAEKEAKLASADVE